MLIWYLLSYNIQIMELKNIFFIFLLFLLLFDINTYHKLIMIIVIIMSDREPTRWQHNRIYPQPPPHLFASKWLGLFSSRYFSRWLYLNKQQSVGELWLQLLNNACDTMHAYLRRIWSYTIIYHDHTLAKTYGMGKYAILLPSSGFSVAHWIIIHDVLP